MIEILRIVTSEISSFASNLAIESCRDAYVFKILLIPNKNENSQTGVLAGVWDWVVLFLTEEKFLKSSGLAKCFADVLPSGLRERGEMGIFGRLRIHTSRKKSGKASEDLWGIFRRKMPRHGSNIFQWKPALVHVLARLISV